MVGRVGCGYGVEFGCGEGAEMVGRCEDERGGMGVEVVLWAGNNNEADEPGRGAGRLLELALLLLWDFRKDGSEGILRE